MRQFVIYHIFLFHSKNDKLFHFSKFMMYQRKERIILLSMYYSYTLILASFQAFINPIDLMANTWAFASRDIIASNAFCDLHTFFQKSEHKNS